MDSLTDYREFSVDLKELQICNILSLNEAANLSVVASGSMNGKYAQTKCVLLKLLHRESFIFISNEYIRIKEIFFFFSIVFRVALKQLRAQHCKISLLFFFFFKKKGLSQKLSFQKHCLQVLLPILMSC